MLTIDSFESMATPSTAMKVATSLVASPMTKYGSAGLMQPQHHPTHSIFYLKIK